MSDQQPPYGPPPGQSPYGPPPGRSGAAGRPPAPQSPPTQPMAPYGPPPTHPLGGPPGQPPYGPPADYASWGGGEPGRPRNRRRIWIGAGAVVAAAALVGGGAFAAASLLGGDDDGPQAAEALPSSTFAYATVDLSKAGGAITLIKKFPGIADDSGAAKLTSGDNVARDLIGQILDEAGDACGGLSWQQDFAPWLGHTAAIAGVDVDGAPVPVGVIQSIDDDKAEAEVTKLQDCAQGHLAGRVSHGWVLVGSDAATLGKVADAAAEGNLADDDTYRTRMGSVGDRGALSFYASPKAGQFASQALERYGTMLGSLSGSAGGDALGGTDFGPGGLLGQACPGLASGSGLADGYRSMLSGFAGAAATVRFVDGGVEMEAVSDSGKAGGAGDEAGSLVGSLPSDTAAAVGLSLGENWFEESLDRVTAMCGGNADRGAIEDQLSRLTGLQFPDDINTLVGEGVAVAVGDGVDFDAPTPAGQPIGAKIKGDPDEIGNVLDKIRGMVSGSDDAGLLGSDDSGDTVAIGPDAGYRKQLLGDGGLAGTSTFGDVVPHPDKASAVVYVDFDRFDDAVARDGGSDGLANFKPLKALGISAWYDGTTAHSFLRLSTD